MPRSLSPEKEQEYAALRAFVDFYATEVERIDPTSPSHPTVVGEQDLRQYGKSQALEGLRQALHDIVEDVSDLAPAEVARLDALFAAAGRMTISSARRIYGASYKRLLKRGQIRSETEYYLARGVVADVAGDVPAEERAALEAMMNSYETNAHR